MAAFIDMFIFIYVNSFFFRVSITASQNANKHQEHKNTWKRQFFINIFAHTLIHFKIEISFHEIPFWATYTIILFCHYKFFVVDRFASKNFSLRKSKIDGRLNWEWNIIKYNDNAKQQPKV